jgi:hypothetical protein
VAKNSTINRAAVGRGVNGTPPFAPQASCRGGANALQRRRIRRYRGGAYGVTEAAHTALQRRRIRRYRGGANAFQRRHGLALHVAKAARIGAARCKGGANWRSAFRVAEAGTTQQSTINFYQCGSTSPMQA